MNKLPDDEKLWAEYRQSFESFVVGDIEKALKAGIQVGVITLTAVGIDCLGGCYAGDKSKPEHFASFVRDFMPSYVGLEDDLYYCVRCGLVHAFTVYRTSSTNRSFLLTGAQGELHLKPVRDHQDLIHLDRVTFASDFLEARRKYFEKAESDQDIWDKALRRLKQAGFLMVFPEESLSPLSPEDAVRLMGETSSTVQSHTPSQIFVTGVKPPRGLSDLG